MKKVLFASVLGLALTTSMVAGTMATYTKTVTPIEATVTAKSFVLNVDEPVIANADLKIAPDETRNWAFNVSNGTSEVNMDLKMKVNVSGAIEGLKVELFEGTTKLGDSIVHNGVLEYEIPMAFMANEEKTRAFHLNVAWDNALTSDEVDTANALNGAQTKISVEVTGVQSFIPVKYVYTRDRNPVDGTKTSSGNIGVKVDGDYDTISFYNNTYFGQIVFEKQASGTYTLVNSTLQPQYNGLTGFNFNSNPGNNKAFSLNRVTSGAYGKEIIFEVGK